MWQDPDQYTTQTSREAPRPSSPNKSARVAGSAETQVPLPHASRIPPHITRKLTTCSLALSNKPQSASVQLWPQLESKPSHKPRNNNSALIAPPASPTGPLPHGAPSSPPAQANPSTRRANERAFSALIRDVVSRRQTFAEDAPPPRLTLSCLVMGGSRTPSTGTQRWWPSGSATKAKKEGKGGRWCVETASNVCSGYDCAHDVEIGPVS